MTKPISTKDILNLQEAVREKYPEDVAKGSINVQAIDGIVANALREYYGKPIHDTIFKQAAALMEGIIRLHPFPDGNKRTALLTAWGFLFVNNQYLVTPPNTIRFMVDVAKDEARTSEEITELVGRVAAWLEERTAGTVEEYNTLVHKHVTKPVRKLLLLSLTGVGIIHVSRTVKHWLASDTHPQYAKDAWRTMLFLFSLTFSLDRMPKQKERVAKQQ